MIFKSRRTLFLVLIISVIILSVSKFYQVFVPTPSTSSTPFVYLKDTLTEGSDIQLNKPPNLTSENYPHERPLNVLLLAYHRTGSSFAGEILSLISQSAYFFEPLFYTDVVLKNKSSEAHQWLLRAIFDCDGPTLYEVRQQSTVNIFRHFSTNLTPQSDDTAMREACLNSPVRIIKTIRLQMNTAQLLLRNSTHNVKIVHLLRDPRAMLYSVSKVRTWQNNEHLPEKQCPLLSEDLEASSQLSSDDYMRVRYEDLVAHPVDESQRLFHFMGVQFPQQELDTYLRSHSHAEENVKIVRFTGDYFTTIRNSSFDTDHWKKEASLDFVHMVEGHCHDVMSELGYERIVVPSEEFVQRTTDSNI